MKHKRCQCGGKWTTRLTRWVVLKRNPLKRDFATATLYCLDCRWKWISRCRYVALLRDHRPQSRGGMTDDDILKRILENTLRIDPHTAVVESFANSGPHAGRWVKLKQVPCNQGGGYMFVSVCRGGKKKKIAVHRLQWMAANRRVVPEGFDVDHVRWAPRPESKDNSLANLRLRPSLENQSEGAAIRDSF